jgi:hypothetical protein
VKTWDAPVFSATEKVVCEECNNGWMGALEQRAKVHAEPMLLGAPQTLNREAKVSLSMWAYLKMLLVQQVDEPVLPRESYETFYAIQGTDLLPLNTSIFIAHHVGARQGQYQHRLLAPHGTETPAFFIATFTVRQLVIQIARNFTAHEPVIFERDPRVEGCDDLIWPATEDVLNWPRDRGLDDEALSVFTGPQPSRSRRWTEQRTVNAQSRAKNRARPDLS